MNNRQMGPVEIEEIMAMLPHRYPFQLLDRVLSWEMEPRKKLTGIKNVTMNEPFFAGHFPGNPVMPGVLVIEAMAQASGVLAFVSAQKSDNPGGLYYLARIDKARFNRIVRPGDQLILEILQKRMMRGMGLYECEALVDGRKVASAEILCAGRSNS